MRNQLHMSSSTDPDRKRTFHIVQANHPSYLTWTPYTALHTGQTCILCSIISIQLTPCKPNWLFYLYKVILDITLCTMVVWWWNNDILSFFFRLQTWSVFCFLGIVTFSKKRPKTRFTYLHAHILQKGRQNFSSICLRDQKHLKLESVPEHKIHRTYRNCVQCLHSARAEIGVN